MGLGAPREVVAAEEMSAMVDIDFKREQYELENWLTSQINWRSSWEAGFMEAKSHHGFTEAVNDCFQDKRKQILVSRITRLTYKMRNITRGTHHVRM